MGEGLRPSRTPSQVNCLFILPIYEIFINLPYLRVMVVPLPSLLVSLGNPVNRLQSEITYFSRNAYVTPC